MRIVILANSKRQGGRCVAGISLDTGDWIRPVPRSDSRAIPSKLVANLTLLDIVDVPLSGDVPSPPDSYQRENHFVDDWDWKTIGKLSTKKAMAFCETGAPILYSATDRVKCETLDALAPRDWKSLTLIHTEVSFEKDPYKPRDWRAVVHDGQGNLLRLKVTDMAIGPRLCELNGDATDCLLTVSLGGPWAPDDQSLPPMCYKLVAGVIEL